MGWALKMEGLSTSGPISYQLSALEVPDVGWAAAAALKPVQLAQSGGAAWPPEPRRCHHRCPPAP